MWGIIFGSFKVAIILLIAGCKVQQLAWFGHHCFLFLGFCVSRVWFPVGQRRHDYYLSHGVVPTAGNLRHRGPRSLASLAQLRSDFAMNTHFQKKKCHCSRTPCDVWQDLTSDHSLTQAMLWLRKRYIINCSFWGNRRFPGSKHSGDLPWFTRVLLVKVGFPSQINDGDWGTFA